MANPRVEELPDDGSFELLLSFEQQPRNWLRMLPETTQLIVRQTYLDRSSETPAETTGFRTESALSLRAASRCKWASWTRASVANALWGQPPRQ